MGDAAGDRRVSRRRLVQYGIAAAVSAGAVELAGPASLRGLLGGSPALADVPPPGPALKAPPAIRSCNGRLEARLVCEPAVVDMGASRPVSTYAYNRRVPAETWVVKPGDVLRVDLVNRLPELDPAHQGHIEDRPHEWTTTNLHTHGLHVSPRGNGDNVFLSIPPGGRQRYRIPIPDDHPAGIFWYHPHRHGAVTQQVRAGMAGMIVVRGDLDRVPDVRAARERIMVLQAIEVGSDYALQDPIPHPSKEEAFFPRKNILYTVNGQLRPTIRMRPGEVQRWRMLNAAEGKFLSLRLQNHDLHAIAWDGLTLHEPDSQNVVMLSAGNRVELMVKAGRPGTYDLVLTPGSSQRPNIPGMPDSAPTSSRSELLCRLTDDRRPGRGAHHGGHAAALRDEPPELDARPIATIEVVGDPVRMRIPRDLPAFDEPIRKIARRKTFAYTVQRDPDNEFLSFGIDGIPFDPARRPYRAKLGTAEEWTIVNGVDNKLPDHAHVFHVHVNPFKITAVNGERLSRPLWRDTWVLTRKTGDSFTFETNFLDFTGRFVQHCHVLSHEDLGMMAAVEVVR